MLHEWRSECTGLLLMRIRHLLRRRRVHHLESSSHKMSLRSGEHGGLGNGEREWTAIGTSTLSTPFYSGLPAHSISAPL